MTDFKLYLFGPPRFENQGSAIEIRPRKALALLIYLAVTNQPHSRDALATLFWPESDQVSARASLRRTLYRLQQSLPSDLLMTAGDTIRLVPQCDLWIDIAVYQRIVAACLPAQAPSAMLTREEQEGLVAAAALYVDDFLAGFTLEDAPGFDEWQFFQQESLRQSLGQVLLQLKHTYTTAGDFNRAIEFARRCVSLDPLHEPTHRDLMQLYAWAGQQAAALRQYQECQRILAEELGVEPETATTELYQAIRTKRLVPPPINVAPAEASTPNPTHMAPPAEPFPAAPTAMVASPVSAALPTSPLSVVSALPLPHHNTEFIGREIELAHIHKLLTEDANCRLLTLVGPSGIGKTRLALEVAQRILDEQPVTGHFADGILFVTLTPVSESNDIVSAIAAAAGLQFASGLSSQQQLLNYLHDKQMLLVLDQMEHLLPGAPDLVEILRAAPQVKLLVTSIESLHLQDAWFLPIGSLSFPAKDDVRQVPVHEYEAIRLFEQRARRVRIDFSLEKEVAHVVRICQLVEGMPLAIELAASWLKVLSAEMVAGEIERSLDILTTSYDDVPSRHRSMRAVLEQSWNLLTRPERAVFKRLSIFRGGFEAEAARAVVNADLMMLAALVDKSLLQLHSNGRYYCHELLRQFAAEQLLLWTDEFDEVCERHCAYYMNFLKEHGQSIKGSRQKQAIAEIIADMDNLMLAWRTAVTQRAIPDLIAAAQCIWLFSHYRGTLNEGEAAFSHALNELFPGSLLSNSLESAPHEIFTQDIAAPERCDLLGLLYAGLGWMRGRRGDLEEGRALIEKGIAYLRRDSHNDPALNVQSNPQLEALAISYLALTAQYQERQVEARQIGKQALDIYTAAGDLWGMAMGLEIAGTAALGYGQLEEAKQLLDSCLTIAQAAGEPRSQLLAMTFLGLIAVTTGEYDEAKAQLDRALIISTELGDRIATSVVYAQLGKWALEQGAYDDAIQHFDRSLAHMRAAGISYPAEVLDFLCATRRAQGDYAAAEQIGRQALQMAQERGIQRRIATSLCMLGCVAMARRDCAQAEALFTQSLAVSQSSAHEPDIASVTRYLGHNALARSEAYYADARQHYQTALQLALKHRLAPVALDCLLGIAELMAHMHEHDRAIHLVQLIIQHPSTNDESRQKARHQLASYEIALHDIPPLLGDKHAAWQSATQQVLDLLARPDWGQPRLIARNLPTHTTPFIGRQQEVADITQNLENPNCRLLTLVGLGGIGKTRLAIQLAQHLAEDEQGQKLFPDGIVFVPLASAGEGDELILAIMEAIGIVSYGTLPLRQQLLAGLAAQKLLLILDNFEHLNTSTDLLAAILTKAPAVKLLVTSRVALELPEAWFYPVGGMSFPASSSTLPLETYEAVQLFAHCAQRVRPTFSLGTSLPTVARICRLVGGMPLAIELATSWLKVLNLENVADEIDRGMDILSTHSGGVSARHQSMRVVLDQTWAMLSNAEKQVFMALAVFRGGFRREPAAEVADATLPMLATFVEKSLLRVTENGRYSIHELLRQFALEKLQAIPGAAESIRTQYSNYYLKFLVDWLQPHVSWDQQSLVAELEEEIDNITSAWQWTLHQNDLDALEYAFPSYSYLLWVRGHGQLGQEIFAQSLHDLTRSAAARAHPRYAAVAQRLNQEIGSFYYFVGDFENAMRYIEAGLAAARRMGSKKAVGEALTTLGTMLAWQGKNQMGRAYLEEALALFHELGDNDGVGDVLHELARMAVYEGDYIKAKQFAIESLAASEAIERPDWIAYARKERGICNFYLGKYDECQQDIDAALTIFQEIGHAVGTAFALGESAWLTWATGGIQSAEAEARARKSLEIVRKVGQRLQIACRLAQLAQFANDRRDAAEAMRFGQEGVAVATKIKLPVFLSQNLTMLAEAHSQCQEFAAARRYLAQACRTAADAGLYSRVLLTIYHAAIALWREAEAITAMKDPGAANLETRHQLQAQAIQWLELYLHHPASWHVFQERATRRLAFWRAQAPEAAHIASQQVASQRTDSGASEEAAVEASLTNAIATICAWSDTEEIDTTFSAA